MDPALQTNRRRHTRMSTQCIVQLSPLDGLPDVSRGRSSTYVSRDISEGGIGVIADTPSPGGSHLVVSVEDDQDGLTHITSCTGAVVRADPTHLEGRYLLGIRFAGRSRG